jgi:hypothetical protein
MIRLKMLPVLGAIGFALAIDSPAHGTGWVITQVAHQLGITKDWMELTPADIDKLSNKQARGLAKIEREMGRHPEIKTKNSRDWLKAGSVIYAKMLESDDTRFFAGAHLGLTIQEVETYYGNLGNVTAMWHSDAPTAEEQVDFRANTSPERRVYIYYRKDDNKIVSVSY